MTKNAETKMRSWGAGCHLAALAGFIGIPFGHILGPLVIWLIKKNDSVFVNEQGKEALNFQISMTLYGLVAAILTVILIGFVLLIGLAIADIILVIVAAVKISNGESFRYPGTIRLIK